MTCHVSVRGKYLKPKTKKKPKKNRKKERRAGKLRAEPT
jgi:hypothetical protein